MLLRPLQLLISWSWSWFRSQTRGLGLRLGFRSSPSVFILVLVSRFGLGHKTGLLSRQTFQCGVRRFAISPDSIPSGIRSMYQTSQVGVSIIIPTLSRSFAVSITAVETVMLRSNEVYIRLTDSDADAQLLYFTTQHNTSVQHVLALYESTL